MFRNILSSFLAASILFAPSASAAQSADKFIYRYKWAANAQVPVEPEPENPGGSESEFGVGNDIDAYFVAPVGYEFSKEVPVATNDVVRWVRDSGAIPTGISLTDETGFLGGEPEVVGETQALYYGFDKGGKRIARAKIFFSVFEPIGAVNQVNWYAHTGKYFYSDVPSPGGVTVTKWVPIVSNPDGMKTRSSAFDGTPGKAGVYGVAWRGYDYLDREVAFTYGEFLVQDGPVIEPISDQIADKNEGQTFNVAASVKHKIGEITYRLLPVLARPPGLSFDNTKGTIDGVYDAYETSAEFQIEARDSADGRTGVSNVFKLSTTRAIADLRAIGDQTAVVGVPYERQLSIGLKGLPIDWGVIASSLPVGLKLDQATGLISGTPSAVGVTSGIVIRASGAGFDSVESKPFKFTVISEELDVKFEQIHVRVNRPFTGASPSIISGDVAPMKFTWNGVDAAVELSEATGIVSSDSGILTAGTFDQSITVENGGGRIVAKEQVIRAYNDLAISYEPNYQVVRLSSLYIRPTMAEDSVARPVKYELIGQALPAWLNFSEASGSFSGSPKTLAEIGEFGPYQVRVTDRFNEPVTSNSFMIKVVDRAPIEVSVPEPYAERYVPNDRKLAFATNTHGQVTFSLVQGADKLPATLRITGEGRLLGKTTAAVGTKYEGLVIRATDGDGYVGETESFDLEVVEPKNLLPLTGPLDKTFTWSVGRPFIEFSAPTVSNGYGPIAHAMGLNPHGITMIGRAVEGVIPEVGTFVYQYTVDDDTAREPAIGNLKFVIQESINFTKEAVYDLYRGTASAVGPVRINGIAPYTFSLVNGSALPPGMEFDAVNGKLTGVPTVEGDFVVNIAVADRSGDRATSGDFTLRVNPPKVFSFTYPQDTINFKQGSPTLRPTVLNKVGDVEWTRVAGDFPPGLNLVVNGITGGEIVGAAQQTGIFEGITIHAKDVVTGEEHSETITIKVTKSGPIDFTDVTVQARKGQSKNVNLVAANVVDPGVFSFGDNVDTYPDNIAFTPSTGSVVARFDEAGEYETGFKITDFFQRTASAKMKFVVTDNLVVKVPESLVFQRFVAGVKDSTVENKMGTVSYRLSETSPALPSGLTLNSSTGRISGEAEVQGSTSGYVLVATDSYDGQEARSLPFSIGVTPRPVPEIATAALQTALMSHDYTLGLQPRNTLGTITWELLSPLSGLPAGVTFNAEAGVFEGTPTTIDTYPNINVRMTDLYRGEQVSVIKTFTIDVKQDGSPIQLSVPGVTGRVGYFVETAVPVVQNSIGNLVWTAAGLENTGLALDPQTGVISGTPPVGFDKPITLTVKDATAREQAATIQFLILEPITVGMADTDLIYNYTFDDIEAAQPVATSTFGQNVQWTVVDPSRLPEGLTINSVTGKFDGKPKAIGAFGPIQLRVTDELPGAGLSAPFWFTVYMNEDPIDLEVTDFLTKIGYDIETALPTFDNTLGPYHFYSLDLGGTNLLVNEETGVLTGVFSTPQDRSINVSITDYTNRVTSKPLRLQVLPLMSVVAPETFTVSAQEEMTPVSVTRNYIIGDAVWNAVDESLLPEGMTFNTATGKFEGIPQELGEFGPITVTSTDSIGDVGTSNPIMITSQPGAYFLRLPDAVLANGVRRVQPYSLDMKGIVETVGINESSIVWSWKFVDPSDRLPPGLTLVPTTGVISGTPSKSGTYDFEVTASASGRTSKQLYRLVVELPDIALKLEEEILPQGDIQTPYSFDFKSVLTLENIKASEVQFALIEDADQGQMKPPGLAFEPSNGIFSGIPTTSGEYSFKIAAKFENDEEFADDEKTYSIIINGRTYQYKKVTSGTGNGGWTTCGITMLNKAQCWGRNLYGQVGDGTTDSASLPVDVVGLSNNVVDIAAGQNHTCALLDDGTVKCWGLHAQGQVGDGTAPTSSVKPFPTEVVGLSAPVVQLSVARNSNCALLSTGVIQCWGTISGDGVNTAKPVATEVVGIDNAVQVSVGFSHACAVLDDGTAKCWGANSKYQLGDRTKVTALTPVAVVGETNIKKIAVGNTVTCLLTNGGAVRCVGSNSSNQLGDNTAIDRTVFVNATGLTSGVKDLAYGESTGCVIMTSGEARCWGSGLAGQIGDGTNVSKKVATPVSGAASNVEMISIGEGYGCLVMDAGEGRCWGMNNHGQLGTGTTAVSYVPVRVGG